MMSQLSCLSSQRLKKDVVDSARRRSRRHHVVAADEMKMVLQQSYFGGKPLPLPKPEDAAAAPTQQGECYEGNRRQPQLLYSAHHDDDDERRFARTLTLRYPPPPVSSPTSSSGKCSPAGAVVVWKPQAEQEHPSPAALNNGDVPTPPPPWSTSSGSSLSHASLSPWSSPAPGITTTLTLVLPVQSTLLPCSGTDHQSSSPALRDVAGVRNDVKVVALEEIERACNREHEIIVTGRGESCVITGWIQGEEDDDEARKLVAVVWKHRHSCQGWKEWAVKVKLISRVEDQHICKLQGYCGVRGVDEQILVYEHVCRGSLSDYLFGSLCKALLDWRSRVRIALGAARALAYLHDLAPIEVVYKDFKSSNILLDVDFSVKLAGHGLDVIIAGQVDDKLNKLAASAVLRKREASNKRNIRSYGVVLLELLTGKAVAGEEFRNDESLFARWAKPHLKGGPQELLQLQLASLLDPQLRRHLPCPGLKKVAALTRQCLRKDATKRPCISEVVDVLDTVMALQPACMPGLHCRKPNSSYKCLSLRRVQPSDRTRNAGFARTLSNKLF